MVSFVLVMELRAPKGTAFIYSFLLWAWGGVPKAVLAGGPSLSVNIQGSPCAWRRTRGSLRTSSCLVRKAPRTPQLEETPEKPPSSRGEGLLFLPFLESNPESSLQTED